MPQMVRPAPSSIDLQRDEAVTAPVAKRKRLFQPGDLAAFRSRHDTITIIIERLKTGDAPVFCTVTPRFAGLPPLDDGLLIDLDSAALLAACERNLRTFARLIAECEADQAAASKAAGR